MSYAEAKRIDVSEIPVIDIAALADDAAPAGIGEVAAALRRAAETVGFFYVRGHGIPQELIDDILAVSRRFFAQDDADKAEVAVRSPYHRGWLRIGGSTMPDGTLPDLKESYIWGLDVTADDVRPGDRMIGPNLWPAALPEMRVLLDRYFGEANRVGVRLLRAFAAGLGVAPGYFTRRFERPVSRASLIHYPPQPPTLGRAQFGVSPHTDFGVLTLLYQDDVGGLQVRGRDGEWLTAHPIAGTLVVNVGDLLARWSNDRFASTPHRVVNSSGRERYSLAVFVDPDLDTPIEPVTLAGETPHYPPVTCGDYILGRYDKSFAYRKAP
jgi:isopenicillin N synthase-like dioxygenase